MSIRSCFSSCGEALFDGGAMAFRSVQALEEAKGSLLARIA
jgi:hypothetical protein